MSRAGAETCASCARFPLHEAVNNGGRALCSAYEVERAWDDPATVLHVAAPDRRQRVALVKRLMEQSNPKEKTT